MASNDIFAPTMAAQKNPTELFDLAKQVGDSAQVSAVTGSFDEDKGVAGRVRQITDYGGPLMEAARTRAARRSAATGTLNTSMATQAGEQAVLDSAAPIATADAQLYQNQMLANQSAQNQAALANGNIRAQTGMAGLNLMEQRRQFDSTLGLEGRKLDQNQSQFNATLGLEGRKLDMNQSQFDATLGLEGKKLQMNQQQFMDNLALQRENLAAQREQFAQKLGLDKDQLQISRDQLNQQDRQFLADLDAKERQLAQQESQFQRSQQNQITLANLDAANRERLMKIEAGYKSDIASSENISRAWGTMMDSISQIQNNPDLEPGTKQTLISNAQAAFQSYTNFWKKVSGGAADVSDLLNFGPARSTGGGASSSGTGSSGGSGGSGGSSGPGYNWRDDTGG